MRDKQEEILIKKAKRGDLRAFEELITHYEPIVYNIIYRMMNNIDDTYDLSQETFIKVYKKIYQFDGKSKFSTWLYRIATNTCLDEIRRRKGKDTFSIDQTIELEDGQIPSQQVDKNENVEEKILDKEKKQIIQEALNEMNESHRVILVMRDIKNLSYEEISEILGLSLGTVKSRISRARQALKKVLMQDKEPFKSYFRQIARREEKA